MSEPEVALAFTPDYWVEQIHRHLTDHGGARVRSLVIEPGVVLEESYDVLVAGHRWPALTVALVADVHARGRSVLGVFDREEPSSRDHLLSVGVDGIVESDASVEGFVRAIVAAAAVRSAPVHAQTLLLPDIRSARLVVVGGPPGTGRTEVALGLAASLSRTMRAALVDADDVAPAIAQRLHLPIEPNVCTAIDAVEHGRGDLASCVVHEPKSGVAIVGGLPNARAWAQVRPGEVVRVIDGIAADADVVVADGAGALEEVGAGGRGRYATARALVVEADVVVGVCDASPHGLARLLSWTADARALAGDTPVVVVVNRAPPARFRRGELFGEIVDTLGAIDVVFAPHDACVVDAAWEGAVVTRGGFARAMERLASVIANTPARARPVGIAS